MVGKHAFINTLRVGRRAFARVERNFGAWMAILEVNCARRL
jgi:hypothetical protein